MKTLAVAVLLLAGIGCRSAPRMAAWGPLIVPGQVFSGPFGFHGVTFFFETDEIPQLARRGTDEILACGPYSVGFRFQVGVAVGFQLFWFDGQKHYFPLGSDVYLFRREGRTVSVRFKGQAHQLPFKGEGTPYAVVEPSGALTWYGETIVGPAGGGR